MCKWKGRQRRKKAATSKRKRKIICLQSRPYTNRMSLYEKLQNQRNSEKIRKKYRLVGVCRVRVRLCETKRNRKASLVLELECFRMNIKYAVSESRGPRSKETPHLWPETSEGHRSLSKSTLKLVFPTSPILRRIAGASLWFPANCRRHLFQIRVVHEELVSVTIFQERVLLF